MLKNVKIKISKKSKIPYFQHKIFILKGYNFIIDNIKGIILKDLTILLSKERLSDYNNIDEHFENLRLVGKLTPKMATLEIILRNLLDNELSKNNKEWIVNSKDTKIIEAKTKILNTSDKNILTHHQYLSNLTLGIIVYLIKKEKLQNNIMNLKEIKFKKYDINNKERFMQNGKKCHFANSFKVDIVLSLLRTLRNRSYHWENILKLRYENNITFPRITTKIKNTLIGLNPKNIETFLDDLIKCFNKDLIKMCLF